MSARDQAAAWIALSMRAEYPLLNWISLNSGLCAVRFGGSLHVNTSRLKLRYVFVVSMYALTVCSSPEAKDEFYRGYVDDAKVCIQKKLWPLLMILAPNVAT